MRQEFPASMPVHEQLMKVSDARSPGRKHQHRPGGKAKARQAASRKRSGAVVLKERRRFIEKVRAYWAGERDTYPKAG